MKFYLKLSQELVNRYRFIFLKRVYSKKFIFFCYLSLKIIFVNDKFLQVSVITGKSNKDLKL